MANRDDFTDAEWELLLEVPALVGLAVMISGKSGLGSVKESMAIASSLLAEPEEAATNPLLQALHEARVKDGERSAVERLSSPLRGKGVTEVQQDTFARCREVVPLLEAKATQGETVGYKHWVLGIADKVARAAKEGGFLGIGGERISSDERAAIAAIREALDMDATR
jgi:hypothetical protein